jgi:hypothetical protein
MKETNGPGPSSQDRTGSRGSDSGEAELLGQYSVLLDRFLREVSATLDDLRQAVPGLAISARERPDAILSMLPRVLQFQQMSLLEVCYVLPGTPKRPGIRFSLEGPRSQKRVRAVMFPDTRVWEVSYSLQRLFTELGVFRLQGTEIVADPPPPRSANPGDRPDWKALLRQVLQTPIPGRSEAGPQLE